MHNVVFVAVVDAWEHLSHEHSCILLCELAPRDDLVEKLTTLADPTCTRYLILGDTYSVTM